MSGVGCWSHSQQDKNVGARRRHGKQRIAKELTRRCEVTNGEYVNEDVLKPDRRQQQSSVRSNLGFALVVLRQMYPIPDRSKDPRSAFVGTEERNQKWRRPTGCSSRKVGGEKGVSEYVISLMDGSCRRRTRRRAVRTWGCGSAADIGWSSNVQCARLTTKTKGVAIADASEPYETIRVLLPTRAGQVDSGKRNKTWK